MRPSDAAASAGADVAGAYVHDLQRFDVAQRWIHRSLALIMGGCLLTAAALYVPSVSSLVGHRLIVTDVHVLLGISLLGPLVAGWAFSPTFRRDARRLNRWQPQDWQWLRRSDRRSGAVRIGKFNAGQKFNAAFTLGAVIVMLVTGLVLKYPQAWSLTARVGATFVHDWLALAILVMVVGHIWFAVKDGEARRGMRTGLVDQSWAEREHPGWAEEVQAVPAEPAAGSVTTN
jgi:cytochrome b subunit of formate dehydrogenase